MADKANVTIRRATPNDAALLTEMGARTFYESFAAQNTPENMASYLASAFTPEALAAELTDERAIFLIAEVDGAAAGYAKLLQGDPEPFGDDRLSVRLDGRRARGERGSSGGIPRRFAPDSRGRPNSVMVSER